MKTTKTKTQSKTPIDVLRALCTASRAAVEITEALAAIDPAAFPDGGTAGARAALEDLTQQLGRLLLTRPLKKTERAAESQSAAQAEAAAVAQGEVDTSFDPSHLAA